MKWTTAKVNKIELAGVVIDTDHKDANLTCITFTDANGTKLRVRQDSYSMQLEVPAPPAMEKKWALTGSYKGLTVNELFDSKYLAENRREYDLDPSLTIAEVEVPVEE